MQQTILNQVNAGEQPQEEVQLTELLPVKRSRIRENSLKDADTTDALKVLRSFSGVCNEEQDFDFTFEKVDGQGKQGGKQQKGHGRKGRRRKGHVLEDSKDEGNVEDDAGQDVEEDSSRRQTRYLARRSALRGKTSRVKDSEDESHNETVEEAESRQSDDKAEENSKDEEASSGYDDDEDSTFLDLDKRSCFDDEVYVFRREDEEPCPDTNTDRSEPEAEVGSNEEVCDKPSTTDGAVLDRSVDVEEDENRTDAAIEDKKNERKAKQLAVSRLKNCESELTTNIDAIIQANNLLKNENNNVVRAERNEDSESEDSSPAEGPRSKSQYEINEERAKRREKRANLKQQDDQAKKYCCVICDARFKASGGLRNHYKIVHGEGPIFKCNECGKEFPLKERLKLHVRTHTGFKPYKCPECSKSFARGGQLVQHRRTHSQEKPYSCALCTGTFTCAANLALHVKRHNGQKDHKCDICGRAFVRRDALKKHLECLHRDVKSFLCVICNKTFKGHLPQHMRTHARDRPHGCATCGQRFAQKSQLTVHQRTHSGQRPFRCLVCWQAFAHSTALKLHTRRHTGERPFKCAECNAGFTQLPHWKKHMKCIHGRNEPYGCKQCKSFFRIKNDLESHEKICHPEGGLMSGDSSERASLSRFRIMTVERMRLLLAVLFKRISKQERLDELGFGKRLIDDVLQDSLISAGKDPVVGEGLTELQTLTKNLEIFLEWTVPKEHWENFRKLKKSPEDILEALTAT